jgi:hypothetical protein
MNATMCPATGTSIKQEDEEIVPDASVVSGQVMLSSPSLDLLTCCASELAGYLLHHRFQVGEDQYKSQFPQEQAHICPFFIPLLFVEIGLGAKRYQVSASNGRFRQRRSC